MSHALLDEIQAAYCTQHLRPIPGTCFLDDYACPLTALAISRGVLDKSDPRLEMDEDENPVPAWACEEFGELWVYGFVNGFDETEETNAEPDYLAGYALGVLAREQVFRRQAPS